MENNKLKPKVLSGVNLFEKEITYVGIGGKKHPLLSAALNILISALLSFGSILTICGMFKFNVNYLIVCVVLAFSILVFSCLFYMPKKYSRIGIFGILGITLILCVVFAPYLISGFYNTFLFAKDVIYDAMYWTKNYTVDFKALNGLNTTFAVSVVSVILSLGVTAFNREKIRFFPLFLITFPFFEIGVAFGCVPPYYAFSILLAGWTGAFAIFASSIVKNRKDKKQKAVKQTKAVGIGAVVAVITLLAFLACNTLLTLGGYTRDNGTKDLRLAIKEGFDNIYDLITGEDRDASMKDGRLYKYGDRDIRNRHHLTIETSGLYTENLYVKGFVGAKYNGNTFTEFDNYDDYQEMFDAFERYKLYPQQMTGAALNSIVEEGSDGYIYSLQKNITISNLRRQKNYAYTFENTYFPSEFKYNYDLTAKPTNKTSYSYTCFMDTTSYIKVTNSNLYVTPEYQYVSNTYNSYVEKEYLQLPKNNEYLKTMVEPIIANAYDDYAIADSIRKYLRDNTECTDYPGAVPSGRDFVNYFLRENKRGYSPHYAATATLMLRAAGVPARYVEGFILTPETFDGLEENEDGNFVIDVTDKEAHAWVEIYSKNYGWISVEVTPGFYNDTLSGPSDTEEDTDDFYIDVNSNETVVIPPPEIPENVVEEIEEKSFWDEFLKGLVEVLKVVGIIVLVIIGIVLALLIILGVRLLIICHIRKSRILKADKQSIFVIYKYFNKLLLFEKIKNTEMMPYLRYMDYAAKISRALTKENAIMLMNIFLKAAFSEDNITNEELLTANSITDEYKTKLLKELNFIEKIVFIFIKALY